MKLATPTGPLAGLALSLSIVSTAPATSEVKVTATVAGTRVVATLDRETSTIEEATVERKESSAAVWNQEDGETATLTTSLEGEPTILASSFADCNENGIDDLLEIVDGAADRNFNLVPDSCEYGYGDLNLDGEVDGSDMFVVLGWFAAPFPVFGDLNEDGIVDAGDMGILLARWGTSPF